MKQIMGSLGLITLLQLVCSMHHLAFAAEPVYSNFWGYAIKGYDPVAYFKERQAVKGIKGIHYEWMGAKWLFSNESNRKSFFQNPEKYAPQYGGYCAWAVSQGSTASIDPQAWEIHNGKLYLNYSKKIHKTWKQNLEANIQSANTYWPDILEKK